MTTITLNRRRIMLGAGLGAAGMLAGGGQALGQAAQPKGGNAGHYRFRVGDIGATVLSDGVIGGPPMPATRRSRSSRTSCSAPFCLSTT